MKQYGELNWNLLEKKLLEDLWKLEAGKVRIILSDLEWG